MIPYLMIKQHLHVDWYIRLDCNVKRGQIVMVSIIYSMKFFSILAQILQTPMYYIKLVLLHYWILSGWNCTGNNIIGIDATMKLITITYVQAN